MFDPLRNDPRFQKLAEQFPLQNSKGMASLRKDFNGFATTPCRGLSLSRRPHHGL